MDLQQFMMEKAAKPKPAPITNKVVLKANYFEMRINPNKRELSQLHVDIEPDAQGKFRKKLFKWAMKTTDELGVHVFDGYLLFSDRSEQHLQEKWGGLNHTYEITTKREETYKIHVKYTGKLNIAEVRPEVVQLFNIILRRVYYDALKLVPMGRNFFDNNRSAHVQRHALQVWPGYSSRIQHFQGGVMLNVDLVNKIVRTDTVVEQLRQAMKSQKGLKALVGSIVLTQYNNKTYRIEEVIMDKNPETYTFDLKDGSKLSVLEYTEKKHGVTIRDRKQPLLRCSMKKQKGEIMLVPELCHMTGLSDEMRDNFRLMQDLAAFTKANPDARMNQLDEYRRRLDNDDVKQIFNEWDIEIKPDMVFVDSNVLGGQTIHLNSKTQPLGDKPDWTNFVRTDRLIENVDLPKGSWVLVYKAGADERLANEFVSTLRRAAGQMQIEIGDPIIMAVREDTAEAYIDAFRKVLKPTMKLAAFIEPMKRKDLYDGVKQFLMNECPIPSQCLCSKTLSQDKRLLSVCLKVTLQIQAKMGGELWKVHIPLPNTMIVGIDVYHDTLQTGTTVVGFCATTNANFTKYFSIPVFQTGGALVANELGPSMEQALNAYNRANGRLPATIIVYRDGVGQSQRDAVFSLEVPHMREAFSKFPEYHPKMAVIIVEKAVNARFFARQGGITPGTVIDSKVVSKDDHDFYLVSQIVTQGTAAPTYYHILCDDTGLPPQTFHRLSYALCHTYANWTGTVRVPSPCQYAHKLAALIGQSIHRRPKNDLANKLYFL